MKNILQKITQLSRNIHSGVIARVSCFLLDFVIHKISINYEYDLVVQWGIQNRNIDIASYIT